MSFNNRNISKKINVNQNLSELEITVLDFWKKFKVFERSIQTRNDASHFIFYDGPPFANGSPHVGHMLTGYAKDSIARFQTMNGHKVERRFGWDCHGLPAEMAACKELNLSGKQDIEQYSVKAFNEHCESSVMKFASIWQSYVDRQGRWVDYHNDYKTMDLNFMESICWAFKHLYDSGLVYEKLRVVPYSWSCETPLSNFEIKLDDAYRDKISKSIFVLFDLCSIPTCIEHLSPRCCKLIVWTTTPWTLPSNLVLAVNKDLFYDCCIIDGIAYISVGINKHLKSLLKNIKKTEKEAQILKDIVPGSSLLGIKYSPIFPYFKDAKNAFIILDADFVTADDGTGIVHIAPGFGEDDFDLCSANEIDPVCPIDSKGRFTVEVFDFEGVHVFESVENIILKLKETGNWVSTEQYKHKYPHCWRTDVPLIYRTMPSWYVDVSKIKDKMVLLNNEVNWYPSHIKSGQFGKWLENAKDWSISRTRFFGTPILVWKSDDPRYPNIDVYGSIEELESAFGVKIENLHRQHVDHLTRANPADPTGNSKMIRVPDVFDCWFESGSMPFASVHYPFSNDEYLKDKFAFDPKKNSPELFPSDFVVEYIAQTRGWFYTLMVLSVALFDKAPFKNVLCHGVILDPDGKKLSKKSGNYADPVSLMDKYGSDALRAFMLSSNVMSNGNLSIKDRDLSDTVKAIIRPFWNAYYFFISYANIDGVKFRENIFDINRPVDISRNIMDRFIISKFSLFANHVRESLINYNFPAAYKAITVFFETLNNWYIRRNKKRFWQSESSKQSAYDTLFFILNFVTKVCAPLLPFLSEYIYSELSYNDFSDASHSVHLQDFPDNFINISDEDLEIMKQMDLTMDICNAFHSIRNKKKIRIRQPLKSGGIVIKGKLEGDFIEIIKEEANIKEICFFDNFDEYASICPKVDFKTLANRIPEKIKDILSDMNKSNWKFNESDSSLLVGDNVIYENEYSFSVLPKQDNVAQIGSSHSSIVVLDCDIDSNLLFEGIARDFIRFIQVSRQKMFEIPDRILVSIKSDKKIYTAIEQNLSYVKDQILAEQIVFNSISDDIPVLVGEIEGFKISVNMVKVDKQK